MDRSVAYSVVYTTCCLLPPLQVQPHFMAAPDFRRLVEPISRGQQQGASDAARRRMAEQLGVLLQLTKVSRQAHPRQVTVVAIHSGMLKQLIR
jgi:hypothetical protein